MKGYYAMILSFVGMFILTALSGLYGMTILDKLQLGQTVREDGPKSHYKKSGTPTFGGLFFLLPLLLLTILALIIDPSLLNLLSVIFLIYAYAMVGFLDDYIKVKINKKGLSVKQKTILLTLFSLVFTIYYLWLAPVQPFLFLPFVSKTFSISGWLKLPYAIFVILYLFFVANAVNITDGVDGLAATVTATNTVFLSLIAYAMRAISTDSKGVCLLSLALCGGCLAFLLFNSHPAKVFMGDTGSQALGAALAGMCLLLGVPWIIVLVGLIYLVEAFSVIIQVAYFKKTGGKRIIKMSPLHHHYELSGWSETRIVKVFTLVSILGGVAALVFVWQLL